VNFTQTIYFLFGIVAKRKRERERERERERKRENEREKEVEQCKKFLITALG
jgi:hypothetical protein